MAAIFISHSSRDRDIAIELRERLTERKYASLFLDLDREDGIVVGEQWERVLYRELRSCQIVIALVSDAWLDSRWCFAEATHAREKGKRILGLKITDKVPSIFTDTQMIDFRPAHRADAYERLWTGLELALDPRGRAAWDRRRPPYPGLVQFNEEDAAVYFGRNDDVRQLQERVEAARRNPTRPTSLLLVLGASGSGKSSLVRAGLIPALRRDPESWLLVEPFRPGSRPVTELAKAVAALRGAPAWRETRDVLTAANPSELADLADDLRTSAGHRTATPLVIIDQLEESIESDEDVSGALIPLQQAGWIVIATLRSDFLARFQQKMRAVYEPFALGPLSDLAAVVSGPARVAALDLEPGLVDALVADTRTSEALPLLAFTLRELWQVLDGSGTLTTRHYREQLGGLDGAIRRAAEKAFAGESDEAALRQAFLRLAQVSEAGQFQRRLCRWSDIPAAARPRLQQFVNARLLVSREFDGDPVIEVAHETLFSAWDRLRQWLADDREFLLWRRRLDSVRQVWGLSRDDGALLRGGLLAEAERWAREHPLDLAEQEFVSASVALRDREVQEREEHARRLQEQRDLALARYLAGEALRAPDPRLGLLLAIEAVRVRDMLETRSAIIERLLRTHRVHTSLYPGAFSIFSGLVMSRDGARLAVRVEGLVRVYEIGTLSWRDYAVPGIAERVGPVIFDAAGSHLLTTTFDREVVELTQPGASRTVISLPRFEFEMITAMALHPSEPRLAAAHVGGLVTVHDLITGARGPDLEADRSDKDWLPVVLSFDEAGGVLVTVNHDGKTRAVNYPEGESYEMNDVTQTIVDDIVKASGQRVVGGGLENVVKLDGVECHGHADSVWRLADAPASRFVATLSQDQSVILWDRRQPRPRILLDTTPSSSTRLPQLDDITWSPDGRLVAVAADDRRVIVFDVETGRREVVLDGYKGEVASVAFSPDGRWLASGSWTGELRLWDLRASESVRLPSHDNSILRVRWSPDGGWLASLDFPNAMTIWDLEKRQPRGRWTSSYAKRDKPVKSLAVHPDGRRVAVCDEEGFIQMISVDSLKPSINDQGYSDANYTLAFRHDGLLASGGGDRRVDLWNIENGDLTGALRGHRGPVLSAAFSPGGSILATGSFDSTIILWDVASAQPFATPLTGHQDSVTGVAFSPDGRRLASCGRDGLVFLWDVQLADWIAVAQQKAGRTLTPRERQQFLGESPEEAD
jgi:WD40 repeat protein